MTHHFEGAGLGHIAAELDILKDPGEIGGPDDRSLVDAALWCLDPMGNPWPPEFHGDQPDFESDVERYASAAAMLALEIERRLVLGTEALNSFVPAPLPARRSLYEPDPDEPPLHCDRLDCPGVKL